MKHLKKKFLTEIEVGNDVMDLFRTVAVDEKRANEIRRKNYENYYPMLITDSGEMIQAFTYHQGLKSFSIPEPNSIVIYFHIAQQQLNATKEAYATLCMKLGNKKQDFMGISNVSYYYFSVSTICATFLFNAIEAFNNLLIPEDYEYKRIKGDETEILNKNQIQRKVPFEEKLKKVIPDISQSAFHSMYSQKYEKIKLLKNLRDEIMHTKTNLEDKPNWYKRLFSDLLNFNFEKTMEACKDYINFYAPNLIEECDCGLNR